MSRITLGSRQAGYAYVELLVAVALLAAGLVPALQALGTGRQAVDALQASLGSQYRASGRLEELLAESFSALLSAAADAGGASEPSSYSEPPGEPDRLLVFLSFYDALDSDGDGDPFTIFDPDTDGDGDPYTGDDVDIGLLWVRVEVAGAPLGFETVTSL